MTRQTRRNAGFFVFSRPRFRPDLRSFSTARVGMRVVFDRRRELFVGHRHVVLRPDFHGVTKPRRDDLGRVSFRQLSRPRRPEILKQLFPPCLLRHHNDPEQLCSGVHPRVTCFRCFGQCGCTIGDCSLGASRCHEGSRNRDRRVGRKSLLRGLVGDAGGTRRSSRPRRCRCFWPCPFFWHTAGSVCDRLGLSGVNLLYSWKRTVLDHRHPQQPADHSAIGLPRSCPTSPTNSPSAQALHRSRPLSAAVSTVTFHPPHLSPPPSLSTVVSILFAAFLEQTHGSRGSAPTPKKSRSLEMA